MELSEALTVYRPLLATGFGIAALLVLILRARLNAFAALLLVSIFSALAAGMAPEQAFATLSSGMGGTLGFIATVIGLGALFGAILQASGALDALASKLSNTSSFRTNQWKIAGIGLLASTPVFFDVALIILAPLILTMAHERLKPAMSLGLPLMAGLAVGHAFLPPTPGPIAIAELIGADLGWVTIIGLAVAIPLGVLAHYVAKLLNRREFTMLPATAAQFDAFGTDATEPTGGSGSGRAGTLTKTEAPPTAGTILTLILVPLALIMLGTVATTVLPGDDAMRPFFAFVGSPVFALLVALVLAFFLLTVRRGWSLAHTGQVMEAALPPAAIVILVTGAGGAFARILTESGVGKALADTMASTGLPILVLGFLIALVLRASQGSATVAILTTGGLLAATVADGDFSVVQVALIAMAIAFGALGLSHVNDSGFWVVTRYLGLSVADGLRTWTVLTTILGVAGFLLVSAIWGVVSAAGL